MLKGLDRLFDALKEALEPEKTVVGTMSGQFLDDWREWSYQMTLLKMDRRNSCENFASEYFKRREGAWWDKESLTDRTYAAYTSECADQIAVFAVRAEQLDQMNKTLWDRLHKAYGLDSDDELSVNTGTGEVFRNGVPANG